MRNITREEFEKLFDEQFFIDNFDERSEGEFFHDFYQIVKYQGDIQELLNGSSDLFPSDIGEIEDITKDYKIIKNGQLYSATEIHTDLSNIYYCWWD